MFWKLYNFGDTCAIIQVDNRRLEYVTAYGAYFPTITICVIGIIRYFCAGYNQGVRQTVSLCFDFDYMLFSDRPLPKAVYILF